MTRKTIVISFTPKRLKLIESALKKSEGMFPYQERKQVRNARRQVWLRLGRESKTNLNFGDPLVTPKISRF